MIIYHISDTHGYHELLKIPNDIDMIIHSGDYSHSFDVYKNEGESHNFLYWYSKLDIKYKVLISGNHDTLAYKWSKKFRELCKELNIIYLENEDITIEGIKIWGSPYTPTFGNWSFMRKRDKLDKLWKTIPDDSDIVVVHGPPKGILDNSHDFNNYIERCGCSALMKRMLVVQPKLMLFGHIHNNKDIINAGTMKLSIQDTIFSNGSVVTDGKFGVLSSNGNILKL